MPILKVNGVSLDRLKATMALASEKTAVGWAIDKEKSRFILFKYESADKMTPFPTPLSMDRCAEMIWEWLQSEDVTYPPQPDHDGDNEEGWLCYNDSWGEIDGWGYQSFLAVEPHWIIIGK